MKENIIDRSQFISDIVDFIEEHGKAGFTATLNGALGSGKSEVFNGMKKLIEKNNASGKYTKTEVTEYNAWESSFFDNPLVPLLYSFNELKSFGDKLVKASKKIVKALPGFLLKGAEKVSNIPFSEMKSVFEGGEGIFEQYKAYKSAIDEYRKLLAQQGEKKQTRVVLIVDDIDKCLPSYQIKLLEAIHNICNIDNVVVILSVDKSLLERSIESMYGSNINISGYLAKFVDYEFEMPEEGINESVAMMFEGTDAQTVDTILEMYDEAGLSLRLKQNLTKEFNLICNEVVKGSMEPWEKKLLALVLILRKEDYELYKKYFTKPRKAGSEDDFSEINIKDTTFYTFYEAIKGKKYAGIAKQSFLNGKNPEETLNVINYFDDFMKVEIYDAADYLDMDYRYMKDFKNNLLFKKRSNIREIIESVKTVV